MEAAAQLVEHRTADVAALAFGLHHLHHRGDAQLDFALDVHPFVVRLLRHLDIGITQRFQQLPDQLFKRVGLHLVQQLAKLRPHLLAFVLDDPADLRAGRRLRVRLGPRRLLEVQQPFFGQLVAPAELAHQLPA